MTCFWMPGMNSLALGFRLLLVCRGDAGEWKLGGAGALTGTHHRVQARVRLRIGVQDQQTHLILQLRQRLGREVSGWDEPLPLLLLLQELQNAALNELLLPQLLLHLRTRPASPGELTALLR